MSKLLNRREAAKKLNISTVTLDRLAAREGFPVLRIGRSVKIPDDLLDDWVNDHLGQSVDVGTTCHVKP